MTAFENPLLSQIDDIAPLLNDVGLRLVKDPTDWAPLMHNDLLRAITYMEVPDAYNDLPNCGGFFGVRPVDYALHMAIAERVSRHDASCVLAMPTPSMPGYAIKVLGTHAQQEAFFSRYAGTPGRSFIGITEPTVGSDATAGISKISDTGQGAVLNAHKKLVGGAKQGEFGLIFAVDERTKTHKFVVFDQRAVAQLDVERLPMHGLAAADISEIIARDVPVHDEMILGHGIERGIRDGFYAMNSVFERYRPIVSAMALGNARGILDALQALGVSAEILTPYLLKHRVFLNRLQAISEDYIAGAPKVNETSRLKLDAISFSDEVVAAVYRHLPAADLFRSPTLLKKCRDAKGWEYMEGTSNIHLLQSFRSYQAKRA